MTSEVAILNRHGVALAADSAVTVQIVKGNNDNNQKIYNSANKLFALSKKAPIGIMISNQADFGYVPWETVIKEFRESLAGKTYDFFNSYVSSFKKFIATSALFDASEDHDMDSLVSMTISRIFGKISEKEKELFSIHNPVTETQIRACIRNCANSLKSVAIQRLSSSVFSKSDISKLRKGKSKLLNERYITLFQKRPISKAVKDSILDSACVFALLPGQPRTTIALAGFGDKEVFPSVVELQTTTRFNGKMDLVETANVITPSAPALVKAFAQNAEVAAFLNGISNPLRNLIYETIDKTITNELPERIKQNISKKFKKFSEKEIKKLDSIYKNFGKNAYTEFVSLINTHIQNENVTNIMNTVSSLPLNQMAEMAEALVNLESFKKQVSFQAETVGGPVDVAVISKGDGLVWVKRKHYFQPNLNYQYFANKYPVGSNL